MTEMTARTWVGGGNNNARNPNDWDPVGAPQPGDSLLLPGGSIINVRGNDLRGDPLVMSGTSEFSPDQPAILNLFHHARVTLENDPAPHGPSSAVVNVHGTALLDIVSIQFPPFPLSATVNLTDHAKLSGSFQMGFLSVLTIAGGNDTRYVNDGTDTLSGGDITINTDVVGRGTFQVNEGGVTPTSSQGGRLEFSGFVSKGQTIDVSGGIAGTSPPTPRTSTVQIDDPKQFHGMIDLHAVSLADLVGLANADSWSYRHDILSISNAYGQVIDKLRVVSDAMPASGINGLSVSKNAAGDVLVNPGSDFHGSLALPMT
jgi:hypothetical protein